MLKSSSKLLDNLIARSQRQRQKMEPVKALLAVYKGEHWAMVVDRLKVKLRVYEEARRGHENLRNIGEVELKMILAREDEVRSLISLPEDAAALLKSMQAEYDKTQARIREKRRPD